MNNKLILVLVLAGLAVLFMVQNVTVVEVNFLLWPVEMSRALLMFLLLAVSMLTGWFLHGHFTCRKDHMFYGFFSCGMCCRVLREVSRGRVERK